MPFQKGQSGNPAGKKPGTQNKATALLKDMILQALSDAGGVRYLRGQATKNPTAFLTLVGKVLPIQVHADVRRLDLTRCSDEELTLLERVIAKAGESGESSSEAVH